VLAQIARELVAVMRRDVKTDWTVRDDVRANLRSSIKRLLVKYKYPPEKQPEAIKLVIEQMEAIAPRYVVQNPEYRHRLAGVGYSASGVVNGDISTGTSRSRSSWIVALIRLWIDAAVCSGFRTSSIACCTVRGGSQIGISCKVAVLTCWMAEPVARSMSQWRAAGLPRW
jgi:hypothetical protein